MNSDKGGAVAGWSGTVAAMRGATAGVNLLALRSHNTALVLDLLRAAGTDGISRLELAERTGLTPQAVSKITARLREEGLAAEAGRRASTGGKPRTVLRLVPEAGHAVGVHVDRDEVRAVLVDLNGAVVGERRRPLDLEAGTGAEAVVEAVAREAEGLVARVAGGGGRLPGAVGPPSEGPPSEGPPSEGLSSVGLPPGVPVAGVTAAGQMAAGQVATAQAVAGQVAAEGLAPEMPVTGQVAAEGAGGGEAMTRGAGDRSPEAVGAVPLARVGSLLGVGVALPGPLDHVRGVLHRVTGFPEWDGFPLREALARRLGVPVVVDKDTNAAALGLAVAGEGGAFAYLHLGTGLGAGLVIGGSVHRGARTGAGEFGHQVIQLDGPPCGCGDRGCIEALCLAAVERGETAEAARVLGAGAANLVGLLDIDLVLLGGRTVAATPEVFVDGVGAVLAARARREGVPGGAVPVRIAPGGTRGVAEGAAQLLLAPLFGRGDG